MRQTKQATFHVKSADDTEGTIEKIVSVFGNVDHAKDRVNLGAFEETIAEWKNSGDPIPVIFSHDWGNLDSHLGVVDDLKELPPGHPDLPEELKDNGGLWVREKYDLHVPSAARAYELQARRSLKESSFAYEVREEKRAKNGVNDLLRLGLIEVGPCLKGMNPATQLLAAKALGQEVRVEGKAFVTLAGSFEFLIEELDATLKDWSVLNYPEDEFYQVKVEATYPDEVVLYLERWTDPLGRGEYVTASYTRDDDGRLRLEHPYPVQIIGTPAPKSAAAQEKWRRKDAAGGYVKPGADGVKATLHEGEFTVPVSPEQARLLIDLLDMDN